MSGNRYRSVLDQIREIIAAGPTPLPDQDLLQRFVRNREEAAFAELMKRHATMVFGVCRRVLLHSQDTEDACQATFLILARRAGTIRGSVGGWLHSVAWRVARRLKAQRAQRPAQELGSIDAAQPDTTAEVTWREVRLVLDEELQRLPEKYRAPLVLCYLEGMTQDEAARQLGWPSGVLRGRLDRGRERLRTRLTRRGLALSAALFGVGLAESAVAGTVPAALEAGIVQGALLVAAGRAATSGVVSDKVAALAGEVTRTMIAMKLRNTVLMLMAFVLVAGGTSWSLHRLMAQPNPPLPAAAPDAVAQVDGKPKPADAPGDKNDVRAASAAKIRSLRIARVDALKKANEQQTNYFKIGVSLFQGRQATPPETLLDSSRRLLAAELELADNPRDRLAALQRALEHATTIEKAKVTEFKAGTELAAVYYPILAYRLEVEIAFEQEKARTAAGAK